MLVRDSGSAVQRPAPDDIVLRERPPLTDAELNALFDVAWPKHAARAFGTTLAHCLTYFGAFRGPHLVGFVKVAWDGSEHAFLLDPTVHPDERHRGLGRALVEAATGAAAASGAVWLHVDYETGLSPFYASAGFRPTAAGLIALAKHSVTSGRAVNPVAPGDEGDLDVR